jgi:hypothetical protein
MTEKRLPVEVWIVVNEAGEYVVAESEEEVSERAEFEELGEAVRYVKLNITLPAPSDDVVASQTFTIDLPT